MKLSHINGTIEVLSTSTSCMSRGGAVRKENNKMFFEWSDRSFSLASVCHGVVRGHD
jgi:hypothetical protein